jgi:hypothetical protein
VAGVVGPGGAAAEGRPGHPRMVGRRLRGHSLRYLPAGERQGLWSTQVGAGSLDVRFASAPPSPSRCSQSRCAGLSGIAVSAPAHTAPGRPLGMGGESRRQRPLQEEDTRDRRGCGRRGGREQDTVCLFLQQPASLTLAAQRLLSHHEEKVGVGQPLSVE